MRREAGTPQGRRIAFRMAAGALGLFGALPLLWVLLFAVLPVPFTPLMVIRLIEGEGWHAGWVPLDQVSPHLVPAIIAAEDNRFCQHGGVDWEALAQAVKEVKQGRREQSRGASTLSMQLTKNLLLWPGRDELRKGLELTYVTWIEMLWSKRRILEVYVNIVEWGPGIYGVKAAAEQHFGVTPEQLTARQAALLAAVLPNPRGWSAGKPGEGVRSRAATIQRRVGQIEPLLDCY